MFSNLRAEQARNNLTNAQVAEMVGLSRVSYESKLKSGRFVVSEARRLCQIFNCEFDYLFAIKTNEHTA